jgi:hypothetical protein
MDCGTVEVLPDLLGPVGSPDPLLDRLTANHEGPLTNEQGTRRVRMGLGRVREIQPGERHFGDLHVVPNDDWNHPDPEKREGIRQKILFQMWGESTGYPPEFYAVQDTYKEDANACFRKHGSPGGSDHGPANCVDYQDDSKRLTDRQWKDRHPEQSHVWLCTFCPYQSVVTTRIRMGRGDYDQ